MSTPVAMIEVCTEFDVNSVCTASTWMPYPTGALPALSIESATAIGGAIALLWVTAYIFRLARKALDT